MVEICFRCRHPYPSGFELEAEFKVTAGVTALFGPSGSGKSTTLGLLAGTLRPAQGFIRFGERVLLDTSAGAAIPPEERRIGCVFQDQLLFPHLSVAQNLRYGMRRRPARRIDFGRVVELLDLGSLLERRPHTLSGGERQRTALGRAILRGPELLLLDEPLAALDEELKDRILGYLAPTFEEWRIPTIFVSHDQSDVRRLSEEVVVMEGGRVVDAGPTSTTLDRAVLTRMRSRPGPTNLLRVVDLRRSAGHWEGRVGERVLHLSLSPDFAARGVSVHFLPRDVTLSRGSLEGVSVRNQLPGTVREVVSVGESCFVAVDIGQFLWAEVTPEAARELELRAGAPVTCFIKTSAFQVLEERAAGARKV
jgi:molybdate transport system ATP-binding protein